LKIAGDGWPLINDVKAKHFVLTGEMDLDRGVFGVKTHTVFDQFIEQLSDSARIAV
jgi:hypothetical protein